VGSLAAIAVLLLATGCVSRPPPLSDQTASLRDYALPYRAGTRHRCVQGGPGPFGHADQQRYAIDFQMKIGTPVHAARSGRVSAVKQDSVVGGTAKKYRGHANFVRIRHDDGTSAIYLHLRQGGVAVEPGQNVRRGELIGYSGDTGRSALPHLHFHVTRHDASTGVNESIPVSFIDVAGDGIPRAFWVYESANQPRGGP
jgi:murein DD-endopeptidase MepM/ murein hydrolase activator NlpD